MDAAYLLESAGQAFLMIVDPERLFFLAAGVLIGLVLGILPGIGGITGLALLLPFTFTMDAYTAIAFLLGLAAVTSTSDTIPAVLFGVPGSSGSQATVLDGFPMAKKGEAGRALAAAYTASLFGGLFGALLLALAIPALRPAMLYMGSPELLAFSIFGLSLVAILSGNAPLRGLGAAGMGIMLAMIGIDSQTGTQRWTLDSYYLWEGLPIVPMVLGLFALPELCDLAIKRTSITSKTKFDVRSGMWQGAKDAFKNWFLVLRCGALGAAVGALPGLGSAVVDWFAYGHAAKTEKGAQQSFGTGDVRGVIAPESANNAKEGGALLPTIAFGVPGSASMAILLGAFMIQGIVPGPRMLTENLDITYAMVWSIAIANVLGAGICFAFSGQMAKLATLRYTLVLPAVIVIMYIGAFQANRSWGDIYTLIIFGLLGWAMKRMQWPRPPLILGFVLGAVIERYMFISVTRYGLEWLSRPIVIILFTMTFIGLLRAFLQDLRIQGGLKKMLSSFGTPSFRLTDLLYVFFIIIIAYMLYETTQWRPQARIAPLIVGVSALIFIGLSFINQVFRQHHADESRRQTIKSSGDVGDTGDDRNAEKVYMDVATDFEQLDARVILFRAALFFGWLLLFSGSMAIIGLIPTVPLFVIAYMKFERSEKWLLAVLYATVLTLFVYFLFDQILSIPWPQTIIGEMFPFLDFIPSV